MSSAAHWLVGDSPALIALFDAELRCTDMSGEWRRKLRIEDERHLRIADLVELDNDFADRLSAVMKNGVTVQDRRVELRFADGSTPGRIAAWRVQSAADTEPRIVVSVSDTGELEEAMRDLMNVHSQNQTILSAAGEGIYGLDENGELTFGNAASYEILGWSVNEVLGRKAHDVHHHSHADGSHYPREQCPIYAALRDGEVHRVDDEVFWHTDGSAIPVEYTSTPILKNGKPAGAVVVFRDISNRKEVEREREEAFEQVRQLKEQLEQERDYLRDEIDVSIHHGEIIGRSAALNRMLAKVEAVARTSANVLVLGESGVGKEMVARAIHGNSDRSDKPLIKVNCASVPKELFESEFFGHVRGAFTGAHRDRVGRMQLAHEGTIFLDEVGEIPHSLQSKLLRVLQEQEFERVGDENTIRVDVRVIAATNRNLEEEVAAGRFREDLYYRLSVFPVEIPPLRERSDDIVPLASHFIQQFSAESGRETCNLTKSQAAKLTEHSWPGNVRELRNVIERAIILTNGSRLNLEAAMGHSQRPPEPEQLVNAPVGDFMSEAEMREFERRNLVAVLEASNWRVWGEDGAAAMLGVKPSTFAYRMNSFGIDRHQKG